MLREIRIKNFAIIDDLTIEFGSGFNVITGETGTGKSVLLEAIGLLLGDRASSDSVQAGKERAEIQGILSRDVYTPGLSEAGVEADADLIIQRRISPTSGNRILVNGTMITGRTLREFGMALADIHGQFEHQSLLLPDVQLALLDRHALAADLLEQVSALYHEIATVRDRIAELELMEKSRRDREELLRFQISEIEEVQPTPGEDERLEEERIKLTNREKLREHSGRAYDLLYGGDGAALDLLGKALAELEGMIRLDPAAGDTFERLASAIATVDDTARFCRNYAEAFGSDSANLDEVIGRLEKIKKLKKKYGGTVEAVLQHQKEARLELDRFEEAGFDLPRFHDRLKVLAAAYEKAARELSLRRKKAADKVTGEIRKELALLAMKDAEFEIVMNEAVAGPSGRDHVEYRFSANPGQPSRTLDRVASGGELSRIMLAIKTILGANTPVLVFDEVDAGIGGKTGELVGLRLRNLSRKHQVICVTHLPQIACLADHHVAIVKESRPDGVSVSARTLNRDEQIHELARMLSGRITPTSLEHARELLAAKR